MQSIPKNVSDWKNATANDLTEICDFVVGQQIVVTKYKIWTTSCMEPVSKSRLELGS
jgi:hypothetical protein